MQLPARLGKYELQQFLGGGMSQVYRAFDTVIGRTVAVKVLTGEAAQDPDARERFLDEARTAAKATHENVISIYDFGVDPEHGLFIVMEFLQGEDLRSAIKGGRTGDLRNRLKIALQAARALDFIHQHRIIHRDVEPENLHLNSTGTVKLMDFGIAKSEDFSRTQPGFALGTPYYMAPEQVRGEKLSCQADVYAYGILLFELISGQKPFVADSVEGIFYSILNMPLPAEPLQAAGVPQPLIDLIVRCTAKTAAEQPRGLAPVIAELERMQAAAAADSRPAPAPRCRSASRRAEIAHPADRRPLRCSVGPCDWRVHRIQARGRAQAARTTPDNLHPYRRHGAGAGRGDPVRPAETACLAPSLLHRPDRGHQRGVAAVLPSHQPPRPGNRCGQTRLSRSQHRLPPTRSISPSGPASACRRNWSGRRRLAAPMAAGSLGAMRAIFRAPT